MDNLYEESETGCCPRFNPGPWDGKEVTWQDKLFLKDRVRSFFHIPLNFGKVMVKNVEERYTKILLPCIKTLLMVCMMIHHTIKKVKKFMINLI